ncbi:hypothetical protein, partial [Aquimarina agarilytica]|uniref:hypothetical protein n=1 Tax=Aquimarina agarilytica TaxID=1087449 RepID=UPI001E2C8816
SINWLITIVLPCLRLAKNNSTYLYEILIYKSYYSTSPSAYKNKFSNASFVFSDDSQKAVC